MRHLWMVALLAAAGCGSRESTARDPLPASGPPASSGTLNIEKPDTGLPSAPQATDAKALAIQPPGRPGWRPEKRALGQLGAEVDAALGGLTETLCETETMYDVGGQQASAKLAIKVRDRDTYKAEWVEPASRYAINSIVRDGGRASVRFGDEQGPVRPWAGGGKTTLDEWLDSPTRTMLRGFEDGAPAFASLLRALEEGEKGFKATTESSKRTVAGKEREIVRMVASSPSGDKVELVVDGERKLPLTVRVKRANGDSVLWTGRWGSGGKHDDSSFRMP